VFCILTCNLPGLIMRITICKASTNKLKIHSSLCPHCISLFLYEISVINCDYSGKIGLVKKILILVLILKIFPNSCLHLALN
jgi:hypothetical protein